jgi:hypothetical protein
MALAALGPAGARGLALALRDETPEVAKSAASLLMEMDADDRIDASMLLLDDLGVLPAATQLAYLDLVGASPLALRGPHRPRIRAAVHNLTLAPNAFVVHRAREVLEDIDRDLQPQEGLELPEVEEAPKVPR